MTTQTKQNSEMSAVQTAENKIEAIRQAIVGGDTKLNSADLAQARSELEFGELRESARVIAEEKATEAARKANLLKLQKKLATVRDSRGEVDKKFTAFEKSLADYLSSCGDYQNSLNGIRTALNTAGLYPGETVAIVGGVEPGQSFSGIRVTDIRRVLSIGEVSAEGVLPEYEIKPLVEASLGEYGRFF